MKKIQKYVKKVMIGALALIIVSVGLSFLWEYSPELPSAVGGGTPRVTIAPSQQVVRQYRPGDCTQERPCLLELQNDRWTPIAPPIGFRIEHRQQPNSEILVQIGGVIHTTYFDRYTNLPQSEGLIKFSAKDRDQLIQFFFVPNRS